MQMRRCVKCMSEIEQYPCPHCGFNIAGQEQPAYALPWETILHGRYLVGKVLGQGGFGITYVGWDLVLDIKVAVKEFYPTGQVTRQASGTKLLWNTSVGNTAAMASSDMFLKEARKMAKIGTIPEIVRVLDTFAENDTAYIVMEFVEGTTIKELLMRTGPMSFASAIALLMPLMKGLDKVHKQGLIHRDISPDNIMQQADGSIRLLDFGAAKDMNAQKSGSSSQLVAKHGFSPLEQYTVKGNIGPWTDVYALCATIYYMVSGQLLPDALDRMDDERVDFSVVRGQPLSWQQQAVLTAGLAVKAENRIQSVSELIDRLNSAGAPQEPVQLPPTEPIRQDTVPSQNGAVYQYAAAHQQGAPGQAPVYSSGQVPAGPQYAQSQNQSVPQYSQEPPQPYQPEKPKKKLNVKLIIGAIAAVLAVVIVAAVLSPGGETPSVVQLGASNAARHQCSTFAEIPNQYEYYCDKELQLYAVSYDTANKTYYIGTDPATRIDPRGYYVNVSEDKIYYIHDADEAGNMPDSIVRANPNGKNAVELQGGAQFYDLQYARLSDGAEYLYYLSAAAPGETIRLYRYDLKSGKPETLVEENTIWFNLDGDYVYFITYEDGQRASQWKRAALDGKKPETLNDSDFLRNGFIEDGTAFMFSTSGEIMLQFDVSGDKVTSIHSSLPIYDGCSTYGDGWIYYCLTGSNEVRRVLPNGTGDMLLLSGVNVRDICYSNDWLWILEDEVINGKNTHVQASLVFKDGSAVVEIDNRTEGIAGGLSSGVSYEFDGSALVLKGYSGDQDYIIVPWMVADTEISDIRTTDSFPSNVKVYMYPHITELEYTQNSDGSGIILTGYKGGLTDGYPYRVLPGEIDGLPVLEIGENLFKEDQNLTGLILMDGIERIEDEAFRNCDALTDVMLPSSLRYIGKRAFYDTDALTSIYLPEGLEEINFDAFLGSALTTVNIPASIKTLYGNPFATDTLETATAEEGGIFYEQNGVIYGKGRVVIVPQCITGDFVIPDDISVIVSDAFAFSRIRSITIPARIGKIYVEAFLASDVEQVIIEEGITEIDSSAFYYCSNLREVQIPQSVKKIEADAFAGCALKEVTVAADCVIEDGAFDSGVQIHYAGNG